MSDQTPRVEDLVSLYRRAFSEYGVQASWNMRAMDSPTAADALASRERCGCTAAWMDDVWPKRLKASAVPLTKLQSQVLRVLAAQRSPDSYIAGGVALNREGPRFSRVIDIFQDSERRLETAAEADAQALAEAGFKVSWRKIKSGKRDAQVKVWVIGCRWNGWRTAPSASFLRSGTNCSVMCCTRWTLRRTRLPRRLIGANPAM